MSIQEQINITQEEFDKAYEHLKEEFKRLQIGRANAALVESIGVESYGTTQPIKSLANVSIPDPHTVQIQPWDKGILANIEKALSNSELGLNPINDGQCIRLNVPPLTEERRADLCKIVHKMAEDAHISIRIARQKAHDKFRQLQKDNKITEDDLRGADKQLQEKVDAVNDQVKDASKAKENDIMTV